MRSRIAGSLAAAIVALVALSHASPRAAAPQRLDVETAAVTGLQQWDRAVTQMQREGLLRIRQTVPDTLMPGRAHDRLDQYYQGLRVVGGDVVRQTSGGLPVSFFGAVYENITVEPTPTITADDAVAVIARSPDLASAVVSAVELVVLPLGTGDYALAYRLALKTGTDRVIGYIDAHTGAIVRQYSNLQRDTPIGTGTGVFGETLKVSSTASAGAFLAVDLRRPAEIDTFDLHGNLPRALGFLNGLVALTNSDLATSANNVWTDGPDVDGHVYAGYTYDYYYKRFGRHGLDNHDLRIAVIMHPASRSDIAAASNDVIGTLYLNAFYAGDGIVVYGEGLPSNLVLSPGRQSVNYFSAGLDIVTHELSHGVTEFSSGLIYQDESGALNEAFSDIMAVSAKFYFQPAGSGVMQANYELGSDVIRPGGIRSFDNPAALGDPDHYSKRLMTTDDNGGVHTNCTIIDHAFYLAIEGGTNRTSGLTVQGVGAANRQQIEQVFYRGFTMMLTSSATFSMARAATIQAALDLYGSASPAYRAVTQAWVAVGVN